MVRTLKPIAARMVPCKCCDGEARIFGVVDFNQNCEWRRQRVLEPCGIPIYYYRCPACGFLFTNAFDDFSTEDFSRWIYNEEYSRIDPEFAEIRPRQWAQNISQMFPEFKQIRILDYGGGNGKLAELLRADGFASVEVFDPFVPGFADRPQGQYDLVVNVEVAEHSPRPAQTFREMDELMDPGGMILLSTRLQPPEIQQLGAGWWYIAPRNGHVSIYTHEAIERLAAPMGLAFRSFNEAVHVLCRRVPTFAKHLFAAS